MSMDVGACMQFDIRNCAHSCATIARQQHSALVSETAHLSAVQGSSSVVPLPGVLLQEAVGGGQAFAGLAMKLAQGGPFLDLMNDYCDR